MCATPAAPPQSLTVWYVTVCTVPVPYCTVLYASASHGRPGSLRLHTCPLSSPPLLSKQILIDTLALTPQLGLSCLTFSSLTPGCYLSPLLSLISLSLPPFSFALPPPLVSPFASSDFSVYHLICRPPVQPVWVRYCCGCGGLVSRIPPPPLT